jgi:hypothetical protein
MASFSLFLTGYYATITDFIAGEATYTAVVLLRTCVMSQEFNTQGHSGKQLNNSERERDYTFVRLL